MYELNLIKKMLVTSERKRKGSKILRILTFLTHLAVLGVIGATYMQYNEIHIYDKKISTIRESIAGQRNIMHMIGGRAVYVNEIEKEWEEYYFKLSIINEVISQNTNLGLILRELGLYLPVPDKIVAMDIASASNVLSTEIRAGSLGINEDIFRMEEILREAFARSVYIMPNVSVTGRREFMVRGDRVDAVSVQIPVDTRKKLQGQN